MTNDECQMTEEIRSPSGRMRRRGDRRFRHSAFVIRHSAFGNAFLETLFRFSRVHWTMNRQGAAGFLPAVLCARLLPQRHPADCGCRSGRSFLVMR
jgi:hypothetical protein